MHDAPPIVPNGDPANPPPNPPQAQSWMDAKMEGDNVPEKFRGKPVAELFKSYTALEKSRTAPPAKPSGQPSIAPIYASSADDDIDVDEALERAGLTPDQIAESWKTNGGKLTDEQYAKLREQGFKPKTVNKYLSMVQETADARQWRVDRAVSEAETVAGGKTQLETLRKWAAASIPTDRLNRLNAQLQKDPAFYPDYIRLVAAEHQKAVGAGSAKPLVNGSYAAPSTGIPSTAKDFSALAAAAARGDESAIAQLKSLPTEQFAAAASNLMNS